MNGDRERSNPAAQPSYRPSARDPGVEACAERLWTNGWFLAHIRRWGGNFRAEHLYFNGPDCYLVLTLLVCAVILQMSIYLYFPLPFGPLARGSNP